MNNISDKEMKELEELTIKHLNCNLSYINEKCNKYDIKTLEDYKALKKFVKICDDLLSAKIIEFKE